MFIDEPLKMWRCSNDVCTALIKSLDFKVESSIFSKVKLMLPPSDYVHHSSHLVFAKRNFNLTNSQSQCLLHIIWFGIKKWPSFLRQQSNHPPRSQVSILRILKILFFLLRQSPKKWILYLHKLPNTIQHNISFSFLFLCNKNAYFYAAVLIHIFYSYSYLHAPLIFGTTLNFNIFDEWIVNFHS